MIKYHNNRNKMMINPANKVNSKINNRTSNRQNFWATTLPRVWAQISAIASLSLLSFCTPAIASLVPPIELPNLDWVINSSESIAGKPDKSVTSTPNNFQTIDRKQSLIAQLYQEILADSREYINHPKVIFLSSLTSDEQSREYLDSVVTQLEKVGASQIPEDVLQKGTRTKVIVSMRVDSQGKLLESSINQSSEVDEIDKAAIKIIKLAAPYQSLPKSMSERYDQVNITRTFFFDGGE